MSLARFSALALALTLILPLTAQARVVTDMRGKQVSVPDKLSRVATIDDGFVEGVMTHLGVIDTVTMIGSWSMKRDYTYDFPSESGETYTYRGWNTMKYLHPWLDDLPCVNSPQGNVISYETLASGNPEAVILRVGDCTVGAGNVEAVTRTINTIEALGLPLVVLYAPGWYKSADLASMREEGRVVGALFGMEDKAVALMDKLAATEKLIRERTADVPEADKPRVLYMGLNPDVRRKGGAGMILPRRADVQQRRTAIARQVLNLIPMELPHFPALQILDQSKVQTFCCCYLYWFSAFTSSYMYM